MRIRTKSTIQSTINLLQLACAVALLMQLTHSQPDCSAKTFPEKVPIRANQSLSINLNEYFQGNNMSFTVLPSSSKYFVDESFQCKDLAYYNLGKVLASQYYKRNNSQILAVITQLPNQLNKFAFHYLEVDKMAITTFNLTVTELTNCNAFLLDFINQTHFEITINCKYTAQSLTHALVSTIAQLSTYEPHWEVSLIPLFSYTNILGIQLQLSKDLLFRGVYSSSNSYIQVWTWDDNQPMLIGLIDKTYLQLEMFNMKQMKYYGKSLLILDFTHGLYVVRFGNSRLFELGAHFQQPFYSGFEYNEVTGLLLLYKKGKVDSIIIQNIQSRDLIVGKSYNLEQYESISKIISAENKIVALSQNFIHIFIQTDDSYELDYNIYYTQNTINLFVRALNNQPLSLLRLYNKKDLVSYSSCVVKTPFLHLTAPDQSQLITVTGQSTINGDSAFCRQSFRVEKLQQQRALIYDNGYVADNEIIFANLPGESILALSKYGIGKNMSYQVLQSPNSKIQYQSNINKLQNYNCSITSKPVPIGGTIYFSTAWQQLIISQLTLDSSLKYFICKYDTKVTCALAYEQLSLQPISSFAYDLIEKTEDYSVSFEVFAFQNKGNMEILVRKLIVIEASNQLAVSKYCTIVLPNRTQEYYNVTQMQISNGRLIVLLRYRKQIKIYSLSDSSCSSISNITIFSFPGEYFAPNRIYLSSLDANRHQILRIRQWNQLLNIRLRGRNLNQPLIMSRTVLPETTNGSIVISEPYLVYLSLTNNKVYCYKFDDSGQLQYLRELDLEGMRLFQINKEPENYYKLLDPIHLAIYLMDNVTKTIVVKVFAFTEIISSVVDYLYATLQKDQQLIVFLKGQSPQSRFLVRLQLLNGPAVSYFYCRSNKMHLSPSIKFNFRKAYYPVENYLQNLTILLQTAQDLHAHHFRIGLSNIGSGISKGSRFPGRGTSIQPATELVIDDKYWFSGSVYNYTVDCKDCNNRIIFTQKAAVDKHQSLPYSSKYFMEQQGNTISFLDGQFIVRLEQNATGFQLKQIFTISLNPKECIDSKTVFNAILSLCWRPTENDEKQYYLSLVSTISFKSFILDQITMQFEPNSIPKLLLVDNIIIVYSIKIAIIYTVWDVEHSTRFVELDRIDSQDIASTICTLQLTSNSSSPIIDITKLMYTVVLTQCNSQIYYSPFSIYLQQQQIIDESGDISIIRFPNIHATPQIISLMKVWTQRHIQIPSDAKIMQTITRKQPSSFDQEEVLSLTVVFDKFHTYRFRIILSKISKITKGTTLEAVYYKFGSNVAISASLAEYLVIKYFVETESTISQVFGCFDLNYYTLNSEQIREHYTFAAYTLPPTNKGLDFGRSNWYLTPNNKIVYILEDAIQYLIFNNTLTGHISGLQPDNLSDPQLPLYTQKMVIYYNNPIDSKSATIQLNAIDIVQLSDLQIALIVIGSIVVGILLIVLGRGLVRKVKKRMKLVELLQNERAEQAQLEQQDKQKVDQTYEITERLAEGLINQSERGSLQP